MYSQYINKCRHSAYSVKMFLGIMREMMTCPDETYKSCCGDRPQCRQLSRIYV